MNFECQESCKGKCCKLNREAQKSFIFVSESEVHQIAMVSGERVDQFARLADFDSTRFTNKKSKQWYINNEGLSACRFFKKGKCRIYDFRPTQCATYPYWPENMTKKGWKETGAFCPGVGKGTDEAQQQALRAQKVMDEELSRQKL